MNAILAILAIGLACNPVAVGLFLYRNDADVTSWLNLAGCIVFGYFVATWMVKNG